MQSSVEKPADIWFNSDVMIPVHKQLEKKLNRKLAGVIALSYATESSESIEKYYIRVSVDCF